MKYTIYTINDVRTDQVLYVGETVDVNRRKYEHFSLHSLAKDWIERIGPDNLSFNCLYEFDNKEDALRKEDDLIVLYDTINNGYNKYRSGLIFKDDNEDYWKQLNSTEERKTYTLDKVKEYYATDEGRKHKSDYYRERYNNDPVFRAKEQERKRKYREKKKTKGVKDTYEIERYRNNKEYRDKKIESNRKYKQKLKNSDTSIGLAQNL